MTLYLSLEQVLRIHSRRIERFGGSQGVRDQGALEGGVARPQATFGGEDLYPDPAAKASVLWQSLTANHPFVDGNRRTGTMAAELFLVFNGLELRANDNEIEAVAMAAAKGELGSEELAVWIRQRIAPIEA